MERRNERFEIKRGNAYYIDLPGVKNTSLQTGNRVCVVISNDMNNLHSPMITVVSGTTSETKSKLPTHVSVKGGTNGCKYDTIFLCEQVLTVPKSLITGYSGRVDEFTMKRIEKALMIQTGIVKKQTLDNDYIQEALGDLEDSIEEFVRYQKPRQRRMVELIIRDIKNHCDKAGVNPARYVGKYENYLNGVKIETN